MRHLDDLSIGEVLCLAIAIEAENAKRYEQWADRFRPYDFELSALFDEMHDEECMHGNQLRDLYLNCFDKHVIPMNPAEFEGFLESMDVDSSHFFVTDHDMAERILNAALQSEERARTFYASLLDRTQDEVLNIIYRRLAAAEEEHVAAIKRRLEDFRASKV